MEVSLVDPDQLLTNHPALKAGGQVFVVEGPLFFGTDSEQSLRFHGKKLMLHRASMKRYAAGLKEVTYGEQLGRESRSDELLEKVLPKALTRVVGVDPTDYLLERRLRKFCEKRGADLELLESLMSVTPDDWMEGMMDRKNNPHFPASRSVPTARSGAARKKQISSSKVRQVSSSQQPNVDIAFVRHPPQHSSAP